MFKVIVTLLVLLIYDDLYVLAPQYHYLGCFLLPFRHVLPLVIIWKHRLFDYICLEKRCLCVWSNICSEICEGQFYSFYTDFNLKYTQDEFFAFKGLLDCNHQSIRMNWVTNLNLEEENLAFLCGGEKYLVMHSNNTIRV
jgi:hypothetical protein